MGVVNRDLDYADGSLMVRWGCPVCEAPNDESQFEGTQECQCWECGKSVKVSVRNPDGGW